jgi:hypothetical protein
MYAYRLDYLYQKQMELEAATSDIDSLLARAARNESEKGRHGIKYDDLLRPIEFQAIEAREKLESLKESGESNWEDLKQGAERAIDDLKASVKDLASRVG